MTESITFSNNTSVSEAICVTETSAATKLYPGLFASHAEYKAYKARFKALAHSRKLAAADMLLHAILLGKDPKCGFTPITNAKKLANGAQADLAFIRARHALMAFDTDRKRLQAALESARERFKRTPDSAYAKSNLESYEAAWVMSMPLTERYGCNFDDHLDSTNGLSMATFMKAAK